VGQGRAVVLRDRGGFIHEHEWGPLSHTVGSMHEAGIYIDDTPGQTVSRIRGECRRLKSEVGLDLVIIDSTV
jgi:replicative DNA helicase